jgi:CRP/FNR family cyclic AMP-dependent transcriptional regulator
MKLEPTDRSFLSGIAIFGGLLGDALEHVADRMLRRDVAAGEVLVREGEPGHEMFVVRTGAVEVFKRAGAADMRLALLRQGACFGEMALIDIQPRSAGVRTTESSTILSLSHADLASLWKADAEAFTLVVMNIAREISRRLRKADLLLASIHRFVAGLDVEG